MAIEGVFLAIRDSFKWPILPRTDWTKLDPGEEAARPSALVMVMVMVVMMVMMMVVVMVMMMVVVTVMVFMTMMWRW